tara:strand:- start:311 stop:412 length:102 start_codon:yes stop_codon:yes gene_type:complete
MKKKKEREKAKIERGSERREWEVERKWDKEKEE